MPRVLRWDGVGMALGVLGWCWDGVGMVLGWCWDGVGVVLGWCWDGVGMVLGWCWDGVRMNTASILSGTQDEEHTHSALHTNTTPLNPAPYHSPLVASTQEI